MPIDASDGLLVCVSFPDLGDQIDAKENQAAKEQARLDAGKSRVSDARAACCLLLAACCLLPAACCLLPAACFRYVNVTETNPQLVCDQDTAWVVFTKKLNKFMIRDEATQAKPMFANVERIVNGDAFGAFIMLFIGINTALLAAESHSDDLCTGLEVAGDATGKLTGSCQDPEFTDFLEFANVVLSLFFLAEMLLKLWCVFASPFCRRFFRLIP